MMDAGVSRLGRSERHQMDSVIRRLIDEFAPTPTAAVIERVVAEVLDTLTLHARFTCYVPLLAERLAREQLRGLVQVG